MCYRLLLNVIVRFWIVMVVLFGWDPSVGVSSRAYGAIKICDTTQVEWMRQLIIQLIVASYSHK